MSYAESLLVLPQPNVETNFNGKVVSLKDTSQTEDYAMCSSNALTEQQSSGGTEQSQLTVSFPTPQFYMPVTSYSSASALDPLSGVVVTSACSTATSVYTSVESTISYPPKVFSESGLTQTSASPVQTRLGEQLQDTSNDQVQITLQQIILQRIQQKQHSQTEKQQLQLLLQSVVQQEQQEKEEQHHRLKGQQEQPFEQAQQQERQQQVDQRQSGHTSEQINQLQGYRRQDGSVLEQVNTQQSYQRSDGSALDQVYPQPVYQRQDGHTLDQVNPQQGYQRQDGHASDQVNSQLGYQRQDGHVSDQVNSQQHTQVNTINEKLLQQQFISSVLEAQAKKLDPNFKLPPNQMFLMLGEKMVIADKSLMNQLFGQSGQDPTLQPQGANQVSNQFQTSHAQGTSRSEPPGVTSQLFGRSNDNQIQSRPQMTQPYAPYQNTGTRVASGAENQPQNLSNLPFQQYFEYSNQTPASAGFQPGYSGGHRNLLTQGSNQSRQSIFPRNNLPFSPANLDDDDLETDSSGLKRKNPVQMYGKTSAKAPNCSDESKSSPGMNKQGVIDLTTGNSSPNSVINIDDEDDDDDLEIDYVEDSSVEYNIPFTVLSESERDLQGVETMKGKSSQRQVNKSKCLEDSGIYVDDSS